MGGQERRRNIFRGPEGSEHHQRKICSSEMHEKPLR